MDQKDYSPEKILIGHSKPISYEVMKVLLDFMENRICKIKCLDGSYGTGFFCIIPYQNEWDTLMVLMTNNHVLKLNDILPGKKIKFSLFNDKRSYEILIDESRIAFTNEEYDVTIIEITKNDGLKKNNFFDLDNQIFNDNAKIIFKNEQIYLLHYPKGIEMTYSPGLIKNIYEDDYNIEHLCSSEEGSSGGPLINSTKFQVIGIHKGGAKGANNYNLGTLLKKPIEKFNQKNKLIKKKLEINLIKEENKILEKTKISETEKNICEDLNQDCEILSLDCASYDYVYKAIIIGDSGVGKTCLAYRACAEQFIDKKFPTIGFEYFPFVVKYKNKKIKLEIWDTCGQEAYRSLIKSFFIGSSLAIIVYAIDDKRSFDCVDEWIRQCRNLTSPNTKFILIGNKNDIDVER